MKMAANRKTCALMLALVLALPLCVSQAFSEAAAPVRLEDDYYTYVNADWLSAAEIRADRSSVSAFTDAYDNILEALMGDFAAMLESGEATGDSLLDMFLAYYAMALDLDRRNADGFAPAAADYARIESLSGLDDLAAQMDEWALDGMPLPFAIIVDTDLLHADQYGAHAAMADAFFSDPDYYAPDNQIGQIVLPLLKNMQAELLMAVGAPEEEAWAEVARAFAFDALLVLKTPSLEEQADISRYNNPMPFEDFAELSENVDLGALMVALIGQTPEVVNSFSPEFFAAFDEIVSPEHFEDMKSWMKVMFLMNASPVLGEDLQTPVQMFSMLISGAQALPDPDETAYGMAKDMFDEVIGKYYGETYFGAEGKEAVTAIVQDAIGVYRARLDKNDWLSEETREMAIRKLEAISIRIGYPDTLPGHFDRFAIAPVEEGGTLYGNTKALSRIIREDQYAKYGTVPDRSLWITTGDTVNAFYNPLDNSINFPAGILQAPFYSPDQSDSANLGGIGYVIGHEISHAFDNNGALFDEVGNMRNWWTDEDYAEFAARAEAMVALFDGIPFAGSAVSGQLTLGENIADAGGISCMLDIAGALSGESLEAFFETFAAVWKEKATPEVEALNLSDTHAPPMLRVNIQCGNADAFYEIYDIAETDGMYIAPEARVSIW